MGHILTWLFGQFGLYFPMRRRFSVHVCSQCCTKCAHMLASEVHSLVQSLNHTVITHVRERPSVVKPKRQFGRMSETHKRAGLNRSNQRTTTKTVYSILCKRQGKTFGEATAPKRRHPISDETSWFFLLRDLKAQRSFNMFVNGVWGDAIHLTCLVWV